MRSHQWKDLATKQVPVKEIASHCMEEGHSILQVLEETKYPGLYGQQMTDLISAVKAKNDTEEWTTFLKTLTDAVVAGLNKWKIGKKGAAFPSAVRGSILQNISTKLSDKEFRDDVLEKLLRIHLVPTNVAYPFILEFYRKLGNLALVYLIKSFGARAGLGNQLRSKDDFSNAMSHRVVHYIAGSTVKSQFRLVYRYKNNPRLRRMKDCILKKIATVGTPSVCQEKDKSYWTYLLNRKSLMFVNDTAFAFFLELAQIVQKLERPDGSIGHEAVMDIVAATPSLLCKWDATIDNELDEDESFRFMVKVVRTFTNTYGRGVLLRRMNKKSHKGKANKATTSVSHRAKLL